MKTFSLKEALKLFADWKEGSVTVRADVSLGRMLPGDAPFVSAIVAQVEGTVTLVDPSGYVSIDGNGCKIGLNLKECSIEGKKATEPPAFGNPAYAALYGWTLAITFPGREYCSVLSYARAN